MFMKLNSYASTHSNKMIELLGDKCSNLFQNRAYSFPFCSIASSKHSVVEYIMHSQYDHTVHLSGRSSVRDKVLRKRIPDTKGPSAAVSLSREYLILYMIHIW